MRTYSEFAPRGSAGVYLASLRDNVMLSTGFNMHVVQHEYTHFLLDNHSSFIYPLWYQEGFAEFLGATRYRAFDIEVGGLTPLGPPKLTYRGRDAWSPVRDLLSLGVGGHDGTRVPQAYPQSWALVHYLYLGRGGDGNAARQVGRYLRAIERGEDVEGAVASSFGITVDELDRRLRRYVEANRYRVLVLDARDFEPLQEPTLTPLDPLEVAVLLGELAARESARREGQRKWGEGHGAPKRVANGYFDWVLASRPDDTRARVGKALLGRSASPDPAIESTFEQALAREGDVAWIHLEYGNVLQDWAAGAEDAPLRARLLSRAREHYAASWKLAPKIPEPYARYGQTFLLEGQPADAGLEALERAHSLLPASAEIRCLLARTYQKLGKETQARRLALAAYSPPGYGSGLTREEIEALEGILESTGGIPRSRGERD